MSDGGKHQKHQRSGVVYATTRFDPRENSAIQRLIHIMQMPLIYNIDIPDGLEDVDKFRFVIDKINKSTLTLDSAVYFNLRNVSFISPYGLLGLLFLGKYVFKRTAKKITIIAVKDDFLLYLERMDFYKQGSEWFNSPNLENTYLRKYETDKLLEIQKISTNIEQGKLDVDDIIVKFRQRAKRILRNFRNKMDVDQFVKVMSEICTNVYTHSRSEGFVAIQRYNYQRTGFEVVKLAVVDYGIGIKNSLEDKYKYNFQHDSDYLKMAMEPGVSGLGDRGFGLYEVRRIVTDTLGYLWINSGDSAILLNPENQLKEYINLPLLRGTRIAIILAFGELHFHLDTDTRHSLL